MTKLIALIDGSHYAQSVCDHAAWVAARTAASVDVRGGDTAVPTYRPFPQNT